MPSRKRRKGSNGSGAKNTGQILTICLLLIVLIPAIFISINENVGFAGDVPGWKEIFSYFGLSKNTERLEEADNVVNNGGVNVHYIDVGQGDCELIQTREYNILIDSGEKEYFHTVLNYLKNQGVKKLDYIVVTHPHSDHAGGMSEIIKAIETDKIIMPDVQESVIPTTSTYERLIDAILKKDCEVIYAKPDKTIELDEGIKLEILAPVTDYKDLNDYSIVMKLIHGTNSFLFTGDIEKEAENDILDSGVDITADVLKVPHHGSSTSSTKKFLKAVNGSYAVIEVGSPNTYNHPNDKVVERLNAQGYEIFRTDRNGNIIFISDGETLSVYVEKEYTGSN